ncbi:L-aspartate oxidase [Natranaerovirga hydrolytica]|uniref:L-aspartate oxidase n=1 Tax=Natranaerovirga hydrolytica TaxID=680378 RepID=A0A4R1M7T7_9FIRM|nr:L-aspartate oxidase [Natranaerovirga hydrolytica]TCK87995.1 L-aspartate oxidase [Natranaerovirga hydrolytica]
MDRYIFQDSLNPLEKYPYDVLIVGSGIAGIYTALSLDENIKCAILSKGDTKHTNSWLAQGGVASVLLEEDSKEQHYIDTINAGAGICNKEAVKILVEEGPNAIKILMQMNIPFDLCEEGRLHITQEGGHSNKRIIHCGGDATGRIILEHLKKIALQRPNITFIDNTFLVDILTENQKAKGVIGLDKNFKIYEASNIVIASGGIGQIYEHTTNPKTATGDGIAAAMRAGVKVNHMEFVQFHPTALYQDNGNKQVFLISEALRGEGAKLRNIKEERFMEGIHPMKELAPRDIVARAIINQLNKQKEQYVYLDITSKTKDYLKQRFPNIYKECKKAKIDMDKDYIKVHPVQHYFMGGIQTDIYGKTNLEGIYACGEAACTGVHGANRLASNSLLECLVFGKRCALDINNRIVIPKPYQGIKKTIHINKDTEDNKKRHYKKEIQTIMTHHGGVVRNEKSIKQALSKMEHLINHLKKDKIDTINWIESYNMALISYEILKSALKRKENIGSHYLSN